MELDRGELSLSGEKTPGETLGSVAQRFNEVKGIWKVPDLTDVSLRQQDFDYIKAKSNLRIFKQSQVIECCL